MILVRDIETVETNRDWCEIAHFDDIPLNPYDESTPMNLELRKEFIRGREFVNSRGESIILGATGKVQEILGLPFQVFENMQNNLVYYMRQERTLQNTIANKDQEIQFLQQCLNNWKTMTLWERIKNVFAR